MTQLADGLVPVKPATRVRARDLVALTKPRITAMVVTTTAGGYFLANRAEHPQSSPLTLILLLVGTSLIVAGANALNMYIEREIDRRMVRTQARPLPAKRMSPRVALWFGVGLSVASIPLLAIGVNPLTC